MGNRFGVAGGVVMVLVLVVPDVGGAGLLLVPAIRRHSRPAELERQEGKQGDDEEATHGQQSSVWVAASLPQGVNGVAPSVERVLANYLGTAS